MTADALDYVLDRLGLAARRILFVSSNGWDVCAAAWFGYRTFWMNRAGLPPERLGVSAEAVGRSMDELVRFVAAGRAAADGGRPSATGPG